MSALLLALVLSVILDHGSGSQRIASRLGARGAIIGGLMLAVIGNAALAAIVGGALGELMPTNARLLFFACTLLIGGTGLLLATMHTRSPAEAATRSPLRMIGMLSLRRTGENAALAVAGVALFTQAPLLTALGAAIGALPALLPALFLGGRYEAIIPMKLIAVIVGTILICAAIACATAALGLTGV